VSLAAKTAIASRRTACCPTGEDETACSVAMDKLSMLVDNLVVSPHEGLMTRR
jgi:hypothetical protein